MEINVWTVLLLCVISYFLGIYYTANKCSNEYMFTFGGSIYYCENVSDQ